MDSTYHHPFGVSRLVPPHKPGKSARRTSNRAQQNSIILNPQEVFYTQSSIKIHFSNGTPILHTLHDILYKFLMPEELPMIRVWEDKGKRYTLDNRRLWVLKTAGIQSIAMEDANNTSGLELEYMYKRSGKHFDTLSEVEFSEFNSGEMKKFRNDLILLLSM